MIESLIGIFEGTTFRGVAIRCGHVVYDVRCTDRNASEWLHLPRDHELRVWTQLEHSIQTGTFTLIGFRSEEERLLFRALCSVKGVGTTTALGVLETQEPLDVLRAVANGDAKFLASLPHIGPSRAKSLVEGLRERMPSLPEPLPVPVGMWAEARSQLIEQGLGFHPAEDLVAAACHRGARSLAEIIKDALAHLPATDGLDD